jgi:hypothetical protein
LSHNVKRSPQSCKSKFEELNEINKYCTSDKKNVLLKFYMFIVEKTINR